MHDIDNDIMCETVIAVELAQVEKLSDFDKYILEIFSTVSSASSALTRYYFHHISENKFISQKRRCLKKGKAKVSKNICFSSGNDRFLILFGHNNAVEAEKIRQNIWKQVHVLDNLTIYNTDSKVDLRQCDIYNAAL